MWGENEPDGPHPWDRSCACPLGPTSPPVGGRGCPVTSCAWEGMSGDPLGNSLRPKLASKVSAPHHTFPASTQPCTAGQVPSVGTESLPQLGPVRPTSEERRLAGSPGPPPLLSHPELWNHKTRDPRERGRVGVRGKSRERHPRHTHSREGLCLSRSHAEAGEPAFPTSRLVLGGRDPSSPRLVRILCGDLQPEAAKDTKTAVSFRRELAGLF